MLLQVTLLQVVMVVVVGDVTWSQGQMANVTSKWWWLISHHHLPNNVTISWSHEHMAEANVQDIFKVISGKILLWYSSYLKKKSYQDTVSQIKQKIENNQSIIKW